MARKDNNSADRSLEVLTLRQSKGGTAADPWGGFSLKKEVRLLEARFIRLALEESGGRVTEAHTPAGGRTTKAGEKEAGEKEESSVILYAEGDEATAREVREMLEAEGWDVDWCRRGTEALWKLEGPDRYDLLLLAGKMAGM